MLNSSLAARVHGRECCEHQHKGAIRAAEMRLDLAKMKLKKEIRQGARLLA